jgi:hypothetical protein
MRTIFTLGHKLILPYFPYLLSNLGEIKLKTSALFALTIHDFCENWYSKVHAFLTGLSEITLTHC